MTGPIRIFRHPNEPLPRWTWRTRLVRWIMRPLRKQPNVHVLVTGLKPDGAIIFMITTFDREIIASCDVSRASFDQLMAYLGEAHARIRLLDP